MSLETARRSILKLARVYFVVVLAITSSQVCADEWQQVLDGAKKVGEVIVWGQAGERSRKFWKESFEKANPGIKVNLFQANTASERDTRAIREYQSGLLKADLFIAGSGGMIGR